MVTRSIAASSQDFIFRIADELFAEKMIDELKIRTSVCEIVALSMVQHDMRHPLLPAYSTVQILKRFFAETTLGIRWRVLVSKVCETV